MEYWSIGVLEYWSPFCSTPPLPHSPSPSSVPQKCRVAGFEADVFGQLRRIEAENDGVSAGSQLSVEFRDGVDRFAVNPHAGAGSISEFETGRTGAGHLEFRAEENADQPGVFVLLHRVLDVVAGQLTVHQRINRLPLSAGQIAGHHLVHAELLDLVRAGPNLPEPRHVAFRCVVRAGLAELSEKPKQVDAILAAQIVNQSGRHQRAAQG